MRTLKAALIALTALLLTAPGASARIALNTGRSYADRLADRFAVPLPPGPVALRVSPCPGTSKRDGFICTDTDQGIIHFPYHGRMQPFTLAHELGHLFDTRVLTDPDRELFTRLVGGHGQEWATATGGSCQSVACPSERFADAYANCAIQDIPGTHRVRTGRFRGHVAWDWQSPYGYEPTKRRHRRVCREIRRLAPAGS